MRLIWTMDIIKCFLKKVIRRMAGDTNVKSQAQPSAYRRSLMGRSYQHPLHLNKIRMGGLGGLPCFLLFKLSVKLVSIIIVYIFSHRISLKKMISISV